MKFPTVVNVTIKFAVSTHWTQYVTVPLLSSISPSNWKVNFFIYKFRFKLAPENEAHQI